MDQAALRVLPYATIAVALTFASIAYGVADPGFGGDSGRYLAVGKNILFNGCVSTSEPASEA